MHEKYKVKQSQRTGSASLSRSFVMQIYANRVYPLSLFADFFVKIGKIEQNMGKTEQFTADNNGRLTAIIDKYTKGNQSQMARTLKLPKTTFSSWLSRNTFDADLLLRTFPDLSAEWLMRGDGPMLLSERTAPDTSAELVEALAIIRQQAATIESLHKLLDNYVTKLKQ